MRYLGNKQLITSQISDLLESKGLLRKDLTLFDAFCGTGSVSDALKESLNIVANDSLSWAVLYTRGRLCANDCDFKKLSFDPFEYLNTNSYKTKGFFFKNYSPGGSKRMYFSSENAARIDYIRAKIEEWKVLDLISLDEYCYLLACLIESVSNVSNTAGVYGAFLKHWDPRAVKSLIFSRVDARNVKHHNLKFFNNKIENIISEVECDILYIDPPYTQNQYGTQYHLLETLVLGDNPSISAITGSRSTAPMRSDWSKEYKVHILFDQILAKTKAKYILLSYSPDGLMSKDFITAILKRYGKPETYTCKKLTYSKYRNHKTHSPKEHFEYLFFIEKKDIEEIYIESPLNYIGSKSKMIHEIKKEIPKNIDTFIDIFGGGFNVGLNIKANRIVYNDINYFVKELVESFKSNDTYQYLLYIRKIIKKFGLEKANAENYLEVRKYYNSIPPEKRDPRLLFVVIMYGFQQQIRFNSKHDFNNPVGMRWFNDRVLEKMISFSRVLKETNVTFKYSDYTDLFKDLPEKVFVYMDPPYRLTRGSYNDGKRGFEGWTQILEKGLFDFADKLNAEGIPFMISYVLEHNGRSNMELKSWVEKRKYNLTHVKVLPGIKRKEVLIFNYE